MKSIILLFRFLKRNRSYATLNFICLSFGLTCSLIALLYIRTLLNHDRFNDNYRRLYSVEAMVTYFNGDMFPKPFLSSSLSPVLKSSAPEIEEVARVAACEYQFEMNGQQLSENGVYADTGFFELFTVNAVRGETESALQGENAILITETLAKKLFGTSDCLGKPVTVRTGDGVRCFNVTCVLKDPPDKSVLSFGFILPFELFLAENRWALDPGAAANQTWVLLGENADISAVEKKIKNLITDQESTRNQTLFLFPLGEKMLYSYANGRRVWREMQNIVIIGCIAFAILLIACFNYINLSVAMNVKRYREAGMRKVVGATRGKIVLQYLCETLLITLISLAGAVILTDCLLYFFNRGFSTDIQLQLSDPVVPLFFVIVTLFTTLAAGFIPSLYLSASNPLNVLKGRIAKDHSFSAFRQGLIVFQFFIPVVLIIGMMIIRAQDRYIRNFNTGIDKDNIVVFRSQADIRRLVPVIKEELMAVPGVEAVTITNCVPAKGAAITGDVDWDGRDDTKKVHFWCVNTDFDYNRVVDINITSGRFFSNTFSSDTMGYVINDVAARVMDAGDPAGKRITVDGMTGPVLGVFTGFHTIDLSGPMVPTIIRVRPGEATMTLVRITPGDLTQVVNRIKSVVGTYVPDDQFSLTPLRDYTEDFRLQTPSKLAGLAFVVAIALACLGLSGIAGFTAESRTKEIGIRRINGASTWSLLRLLLKGYAKWITIASVTAIPVALFLGKMFLGRYYFHTPVPVAAFIAGPLVCYAVALLTVGLQTMNAARRNPADTLRYE